MGVMVGTQWSKLPSKLIQVYVFNEIYRICHDL